MLNPTGGKIRNDEAGAGHHGAPRGSRKHNGTDFECDLGQEVISPIDGTVERYSFPYVGDNTYKGLVIANERMSITMFYLQPTVPEGTVVKAGEVVGHAQDISLKHGGTAHIHLRVNSIDPMLLVDEKMPDDPGVFVSHV